LLVVVVTRFLGKE